MELNTRLQRKITLAMSENIRQDADEITRHYVTGFKDALESMLLALQVSGVAVETLADALDTAIEAYENNI